MNLFQLISDIERCRDQSSLKSVLQKAINNIGFSSYCFLDVSTQYAQSFNYFGTTGHVWEEEYQRSNFFQVDEVIKYARRTNKPFCWSNVPLPKRLGRKKPAAQMVFEAACDHHFTDGLVVPLHFVDDLGRMHSALCSLVWKDSVTDFRKVTSETFQQLHLLLIYWMQRSIDIKVPKPDAKIHNISEARSRAFGVLLTDRERETIAWAGRGKTVNETADILSISSDTVNGYVKTAIFKLEAGNKTHAVAKAIHLGLIDV